MRLSICFLVFNIFLLLNLNAQGYRVTVKVADEKTGLSLSRANVEVEQLPGTIIPTDSRGLAIFNDVPEGRISVRVSLSGYLPKVEHYGIVSREEKNNYHVIKLVKM